LVVDPPLVVDPWDLVYQALVVSSGPADQALVVSSGLEIDLDIDLVSDLGIAVLDIVLDTVRAYRGWGLQIPRKTSGEADRLYAVGFYWARLKYNREKSI
jgi:hypothetical protein